MELRSLAQTYHWPALASALVLVSTMALAPAASADTTGNVTVSASVTADNVLSLTLCDTEANFGTGLNAHGGTPTETTDNVVATSEGAGIDEGVFYRWTPECLPDHKFIQIQSSIFWVLRSCALENTGTNPDLSIADSDLRWSSSPSATYEIVQSLHAFTTCDQPSSAVATSGLGDYATDRWSYLRVDDNDASGTFNSTITYTLTP